jgi:hypothetical protein
MTCEWKPLLFWTPRVLGLLFAVYLSFFAFMFSQYSTPGKGWMAFAAWSSIIWAALAFSWRWSCVGGLLFVGLGLWCIVERWRWLQWEQCLWLEGPLFLVGALFLIDWVYRARLRTG